MSKWIKKALALLLSIALVLSGIGTSSISVRAEGESVLATETDAPTDEQSTEEVSTEEATTEESAEDPEEENPGGLYREVEGIRVSVNDKNSILPEGAYIKVEKIEDETALQKAQDVAGTTAEGTELIRDAVGVDITFYNSDGVEFEPSDDVEVNIDIKDYRNLEIEDDFTNPSFDVLHIPDEGEPEFIENTTAEDDSISFDSDEFSTYIITVSPLDLFLANNPDILSGYSDYSPYIKSHILTVDNKELLTGDTIEPSQQFKLELSFNMKLNDMSKNITETTDGLHYYFPLPDHISIGDKGSPDSQIPLYNSRNVQIGTYYIKADAAKGDVMYVTFPGFYDDVTTNFELSASWSDTEDKDSIEVPWADRTDKFFINRTSLTINKEQTHARRGEDGITRNKFTISIKAKDDQNDVQAVSFKDEMTSQHMILDPESIDDGAGNKYAFKITSYDQSGVIVGDPIYKPASAAETSDAGVKGTRMNFEIGGLTVPKGGKVVVEYTVYIPREVKREMDENDENDTLVNTAAASHPVTNRQTGQIEHPWITSEVTDNLIHKKDWLLKDADNQNLIKVTDEDSTEYIAMGYDIEINNLREYTMGGALVRDVISNSYYDEEDIKYTNVTYDVKNLAKEKPHVIKTVKANTTTTRELTWITLDNATYSDFLSKIDTNAPLGALDRLKNDAALAGVRTALQNAVSNAGYTFSGDYSDYIFTDNANHEFIWLIPEDDDDPDRPGDKIPGTYKLEYHTVSGLGVGSFANSASLRYRELDPIRFNAVGEPGNYNLKDRKIEARKYNEGVYLGDDGNYYVDWTISVGVPANSRGWEDIMIIDEFPRYQVGDNNDPNKIIYSDWLKGLAAPDYDSYNSGVFQFSTESNRPEVQAITERARVGLDNGYWNGYSEIMTSNYINGVFVEKPDSEWIDYLSRWNSGAFNATVVSRGTYYSGKDLAAGQFIAQEDGTDWISPIKKGDTGTINNYTIYLGDLPSSGDEGYDVKIKYTTQVNPLLISRLSDILEEKGETVATLTNVARVYHSYVKRDKEGNILGRALMQGGTGEGFIKDELRSSYWIGAGDADDCIVKDKTDEYNKTTGTVPYKSSLNNKKQLEAHKNIYTIQDAMNVPGILYQNINLKFPSDVSGGADIIKNGVVQNAYKDYVTIKKTDNADSSNSLTITFDNKDNMFQDANGKVAQLVLTYDADFKTNDVPTDVTLNNAVVLSESVYDETSDTYSTKLIDQADVEYTVDKALDKTLDKGNLPSEANNFTAGYSIVVDPNSANAKELKTMAVGESFTVRDTMGSNMDLILSSVSVNMIENGTPTDITSDTKRSYNANSRVLEVKIPKKSETATYKIDYSVNISHLSKDGAAYVRNKVEILGTTVKQDELNDRISIMNSSESSDATTNMIRIQKYDMDNIDEKVDATYDIYKYDNGWKCLTSGPDRIYDTDFPLATTDGEIIITNKIPDDKPHNLIEEDTWYKLVEIDTDEDYSINNEPLYYYVSVDGQTHKNPPYGVNDYVIATLIKGKSESEIEKDTLPTLLFGNKQMGFAVKKINKGTGDPIKDVEFGVYSDEACSNLITSEITDEKGIAEFKTGASITGQGVEAVYLKEIAPNPDFQPNDSIYKVTFEDGILKSAVNIEDAQDSLKVDTSGALGTVEFPNISNNNSLIIKKTLQSRSNTYNNEKFEFVINLYDASGTMLTDEYPAIKYDSNGIPEDHATPILSGDTFTLKTGERLEIEDLPTDAKYTVSEYTPMDYTPSVKVEDKIGSDSKSINANNTSGTIEQGSSDVVTFNNRRKTSLVVTKAAVTKDDTPLTLPDGFTITIRSHNTFTGPVLAKLKYNSTSGQFESEYMADQGMRLHNDMEDGSPINGGFRITGIDTDLDLAVIESNADIPGYAYKLVDANYDNINARWSGYGSDDRTLQLKNIYTDAYAEVNITANKKLAGRAMEEGEFQFDLYELMGDNYSKLIKTGITNDATGKVDFGRITYTLSDLGDLAEKDVYYRITEVPGQNRAITYDRSTAVYVKVHLRKEVDASSGDVELIADDPVYSSTDMRGGEPGDGIKPDFLNRYYAEGDITLLANKALKGINSAAGLFNFKITEYEDAQFTKALDTNPVATASSSEIAKDSNTDLSFSKINYFLLTDQQGGIIRSDVGTHFYIIEEDIPGDAQDKTLPGGDTVKYKDGIIYDGTQYKVAVVVGDDKEGHLTTTVREVEDDGTIGATITAANYTSTFTFENEYKAEGSVEIKGNKVLTGRDINGDEFGFTLKEYTDDTYTTVKKDGTGADISYSADSSSAEAGVKSSFTFGELDYDAEGVHYYKISEDQPTGSDVETIGGKKKKAGVLYDNTEYTFTANVTDDGKGNLTVTLLDADGNTITDTESTFAFKNEYSAEGDITFKGNKIVEGHDISFYEPGMTYIYAFYIDEIVGGTQTSTYYFGLVDQPATVDPATRKAEGAITFTPIDYVLSDVGVHEYIVYEHSPNSHTEPVNGITYDQNAYKVTVNVSDNGDGTLKAEITKLEKYDVKSQTVTEIDTDADLDFTNVYNAETSMTISATKTIDAGAKTLADSKTFNFELIEVSGTTETVLAKGTNDESGKITFYDPDDETSEFKLHFLVDGANEVEASEKVGRHTYKIVEVDNRDPGYIYDDTEYEFTLSVMDNFDGTLHIEDVDGALTRTDGRDTDQENDLRTYSLNLDQDKDANFVNSYEAAGEITFNGIKTLQGLTTAACRTLDDDEFEYTVTEYTDDTYETEKGTAVYSGISKADGSIVFDTMGYERNALKDDVGTHYYRVLETVPEDAEQNEDGSFTYKGVTYSQQSYDVVVNVTDNDDGTLECTTSGIDQNLDFTNYYSAEGSTTISLTKETLDADDNVYAGIDTKSEDGEYTFTFELSEVTIDNGVEVEEVISNAISGLNEEVSFPEISYDLDGLGEHLYRVREVQGDMSGFTYDDTVYEVKVNVTDNRDGTLDVQQEIVDNDEILFTNRYDAGGDITFDGIKTVENIDKFYNKLALQDGMFSFSVIEMEDTKSAPIVNDADKSNLVATGKNKTDGSIDFTKIAYGLSDIGMHTYIITEDSDNPVSGIVYDTEPVIAHVMVSDAGDGTLTTEVEYEKLGKSVSSAVFDNATSITRFKKTDKDGKGLSGAEFKITTKDGKVVTSFTSNGSINEVYGLALETDYILTETKAPTGYKTAADVNFKLDKDGQLYVEGKKADQITVVDEKLPAKTSSKKTGDDINMMIIMLMMLSSLVGIALLERKKKFLK